MRAIFGPAIALMNRLRFGAKLGVVSALFLLPLIILGFGYLSVAVTQLRGDTAKLEAAEKLPALLHLHARFGDYLTAAYAVRAGNNSQNEAARLQAADAVREAAKQLQAQFDDEVLQADVVKWSEQFAQLNEQPVGGVRDVSELTPIYSPAARQLDALFDTLSERGQLLFDPQQDSWHLSNLVTARLLQVLNSEQRIRYYGSYALQLPTIDSTTFDVLSAELDDLFARQTLEMDAIRAALPASQSDTLQYVDTLLNAWQQLRDRLQNDVVEASDITITFAQWQQQSSDDVNVSYQGAGHVAKALTAMLQARVNAQRGAMALVLILTIASGLTVAYLFMGLSYSVKLTLSSFHKATQQFADGNTRVRAPVYSQDELAELVRAFNDMAESVDALVRAVKSTTQEVGEQADAVRAIASRTDQAAGEQQRQTEMASNIVANMSQLVQQQERTVDATNQAVKISTDALNRANSTVLEAVSSTRGLADEIARSMASIEELAEQSKNISNVLNVIKSIAEQTNLLALNAAIEAARAGEQGRGFAVVADEVRNLAQRTQTSAKEVDETMLRLLNGISETVNAMARSQQRTDAAISGSANIESALQAINHAIADIATHNQNNIATATQQSRYVDEVNRNFLQIRDDSAQVAKQVENSVNASQRMTLIANQLRDLLAKFRE